MCEVTPGLGVALRGAQGTMWGRDQAGVFRMYKEGKSLNPCTAFLTPSFGFINNNAIKNNAKVVTDSSNYWKEKLQRKENT